MIHVHIEHTAVIPFFLAGFGAIGGGTLKVEITLPNATKEQSLKTIFKIYQVDKKIDIHSESQILIRTDIYHQLYVYSQ